MSEPVEMFAIYKNPSDYPDRYVLRRWLVTDGGFVSDKHPMAVWSNLEEIRGEIPKGKVNIGRKPEDDPVIVEVWV